MKTSARFPLLAKVLGCLSLHLAILGLSFFLFVRWQLGLGLDSLLSGAAGERMSAFGDAVATRIAALPPAQWNDAIKPLADAKQVTAVAVDARNPADFPPSVPNNVLARIRSTLPPPSANPDPARPGQRPPPPQDAFDELDFPPPGEGQPAPPGELRPPPPAGGMDALDSQPPRDAVPPRPADRNVGNVGSVGNSPLYLPKSRPAFLVRAENGDGYWAGVLLHLPVVRERPVQQPLLLIHARRLDGSGMFFDIKPWLWGGMAVLLLSLAFWTPFVWGITRYLHRLTAAADRIASGRFQVSLPARGNDELGNLGRTIESMAARLEHLIAGQKRFLGDAAHELCAPLARIRTGLGILEMKLANTDLAALASIEADTAELATLVEEILAFARAGNRAPAPRSILLEPLVREVLAREAADAVVGLVIPPALAVMADPLLLGRALGNLIRNAFVHAGPQAKVSIHAAESADAVSITVTDDGPGVPPAELARLFEPFYRLDRSRNRDTGGSGLGLAIVRTAIESCGGSAVASLPANGGFAVTLSLPKNT